MLFNLDSKELVRTGLILGFGWLIYGIWGTDFAIVTALFLLLAKREGR